MPWQDSVSLLVVASQVLIGGLARAVAFAFTVWMWCGWGKRKWQDLRKLA